MAATTVRYGFSTSEGFCEAWLDDDAPDGSSFTHAIRSLDPHGRTLDCAVLSPILLADVPGFLGPQQSPDFVRDCDAVIANLDRAFQEHP